MDINQPTRPGSLSIIQQDTEQKTKVSKDSGRYYNSSYSIENFVNVLQASEGTDTFKVFNDPTYTGFKLFFHFDSSVGLLADESNVNSALAYLKRIGQDVRYELLKRFINILSKVNSICPWMFQDIEGLQELYAEQFEEIYKKHQLTINCLETVDGKIGSLVQMYKSIVYDHHNRKYIVPINLRRFSMSIYVYDFRMFSDLDPLSVEFLQTIQTTDITKLNHTLFDLGYCQFNPASGGAFFSEVSNNRSDANMNNLVIDYEQYDISGMFRTLMGDNVIGPQAIATIASTSAGGEQSKFDAFLQRNSLTEVFDKAGGNAVTDKIEMLLNDDEWRTRLNRFTANTEAEAFNLVRARLAKLYLGNVYGFDTADVLNIQSASAASLSKSLTEIPSLKTPGKYGADLGNVNE